MPSPQALPSKRLRASYDPSRLQWNDSSQIPLLEKSGSGYSPFQARAMQALDLALQIPSQACHVYFSGEADLGRTYTLLSFLKPRAEKLPSAPDLVYVQNFRDQDRPLLLALPSGHGQKLKKRLKEFITQIGSTLEKTLNTLPFQQARNCLVEESNSSRSGLLSRMDAIARERGFSLELDETGGIALAPLSDAKRDAADNSTSAEPDFKFLLRKKGDSIARNLMDMMRQLNRIDELFQQEEEKLERKAMREVLDSLFPNFVTDLFASGRSSEIDNYLEALKNDLLENSSLFLPENPIGKNEERPSSQENEILSRYTVNIFVDNSSTSGAPIIIEDNPAITNLMGCMERESELGALVTDFTLIRSGSLQKANGGFLILHIEDLLQHPQSWEALLRALRSSYARIEDGGELPDAAIRTKSLSPEPLKLDLKVILIGNEDIFEELLLQDDRFGKLFKIKAHMTDQALRNAVNVRHYLTQIARIIHEAQLPPFNRSALAWLVDLGSHLCEDQKRLSLKFPVIRNYMLEACALAKSRHQDLIDSAILEEAYAKRSFRSNLVEELFMEDYDRQLIKLETNGSAIGQVNGLSVAMHGDFEFGLPHRISCTVGVGHDGIIDLERESDLGGPIHTKAMLILKGYLTRMFARKKPLVLNASLYFEQSYAGIEGDSASGAELVALLSALAEVPVRLDLAFTGALGHSGQIMAVGGVSRKIEGFYKVCARKGLTGSQGVIIPADNLDHLMLSPEILESVDKNQFSIYAVRNIEEALLLLTGMPAGKIRKDDSFTRGSLYDLVDRRLEYLGCHAQNTFRRSRKD